LINSMRIGEDHRGVLRRRINDVRRLDHRYDFIYRVFFMGSSPFRMAPLVAMIFE
jgi:hypothetical protein